MSGIAPTQNQSPLSIQVNLPPQHPVADVIQQTARLILQIGAAIGTIVLSFSLAKHSLSVDGSQALESALKTIFQQK